MFREALLQSPRWRSFQEQHGKTCVNGDFGLGVVETLPIVGQYLYLPRGPVVEISNIKYQNSKLKEELLEVAQQNKVGWVRVEPGSEEELADVRHMFSGHQITNAPHDVQPREILVLDIEADEAALLAAMKSKTRYNVRLAEKHGVTIRFSRAVEDIETFIALLYATTNRKAIRPHPKSYYRNFFTVFPETECTIALAEHEGRVLAANLMVFWDGAAYYLHGGSSDEGRNLMAPYLLQWECIREAKRRGCKLYDFGGVSIETSVAAWQGITRFKQGFAPVTKSIVFPGAYDIVIAPWRYQLYRVLQRLQTIRKKLSQL